MMNAVPPIIYNTECVSYDCLTSVFMSDKLLDYINIKSLTEFKNDSNRVDAYGHSINEENITTMENNVSIKRLSELCNKETGEIIILNHPITFRIEIDEDGIYYNSDKYNLYVYGETQSDAENNLVDAFKDQIEIFGKELDVNLDENARRLKRNLLEVYSGAKKKE